jgi:hypothetical protein
VSGFAAACLAYGVLCTGLLIIVLGSVDDIRAQLRREKALRAAGDQLLSHEQIAVRDTAVAMDRPVRHVTAHLERAMWTPPKGPAA